MLQRTPRLGIFTLSIVLAAAAAARADQPAATTTFNQVRVVAVANDQLSIDVFVLPKMTPQHFLVRDTALQNNVKGLHKGDRLTAVVSADNNQWVLQAMAYNIISVGKGFRVVVMAGAILVFWLVCFLFSGFHPGKLIVGEDGRFSNSKFQTALWFGVLISAYLATLWLRVHELGGDMLAGINIPQNLLLLSGISAITYTAAKGITVSKMQNAAAAGIVNAKPWAAVARFWADLTCNDSNQFDLGDFQMLVMTFLAVGTFLALVFHFLGSLEARTIVDLPDVDTTILASFGLGHGAYLTKKAVGGIGES